MDRIRKITILELAPCADTIYHIRRDPHEGYLVADGRTLALRSGVKLRPRTVSTYAGGKSTNVARVMDRLLEPEDGVEVELVVFIPDSPEGHFISELQSCSLTGVHIRRVIIKGSARFCIDLSDPDTDPASRVEFNISPRVLWEPDSFEVAMEYLSRIRTELVLFAGNPPALATTGELAADLYARILELVGPYVKAVSVDLERTALAGCVASRPQPSVIKINDDEYRSIDEKLWAEFHGTLVVTGREGSWVWENRATHEARKVLGAEVRKVFSTIGAGDAVHAGFTLARWVWGYDLVRSARYGLAAAAAAVSSPIGTRGITKQAVAEFFNRLDRESPVTS